MQRVGARELAEIVALQNVEHLDQRHAAGGGRRHGDDIVAAIAAAHRRALDRAVILQIVRRHDAAGAAHRGRDLRGGTAFVEGARPAVGDRLQGVGEIELQQPVAFMQRLAAVEEDAGRRGPARQPLFCMRQGVGGVVLDREALLGQAYRRRNQVGERELAGAVFLVRQRQACHRAGHADRKGGVA